MDANRSALYNKTIEILSGLVLNDKIQLADIPFEIRLTEPSMYRYSFRVGRTVYERHIKTICILMDDIRKCQDSVIQKYLAKTLFSCVEENVCEYTNEKRYETFLRKTYRPFVRKNSELFPKTRSD